jgi:hypothetical protein
LDSRLALAPPGRQRPDGAGRETNVANYNVVGDTLGICSHVTTTMQQDAAERLNIAFGSAISRTTAD